MQALSASGICHAVIMNPINTAARFRKDKILVNLRPLDKRLQGNCVYLKGSKSFVSILMATKGGQGDSICSWCTTQNDFHVLHS